MKRSGLLARRAEMTATLKAERDLGWPETPKIELERDRSKQERRLERRNSFLQQGDLA